MANRNYIETLFKTYYLRLHQLAAVMLRDDDQASDVVHDVFASLLNGNHEAEISAGYLFKAVRNRSLSLMRNLDTQAKVKNLYFLEAEEYDTENWPDEETVGRIYQIIKSELTPQTRRVMELRFVEGLPFTKVAENLEISETAVYKHVRQALAIIRKKLEVNG